jgi:hypothetical protein
MKTIFITIFDGAISKNVLRTDVFRVLKQHYKIVLFVHQAKYEYYVKEFGEENVLIEKTPAADHPLFEGRFHALALDSLHTETVKIKIRHDYAKKGNYPKMLLKFLLWQLGRFKAFHRAMRFVYRVVPDHSFDLFFKKYQPDGVFVPNMISNEDFRLVKAARRFGVRTVGMPKSWDNFTGKTFFNIFPDIVLVQNRVMYGQAQELFEYPKELLTVVGFPCFDVYADSPSESREAFSAALDLDPKKKTILYAAGGHQLAPHDEKVLNLLIDEIDRSSDLKDSVQLLVRPHPKYNFEEGVLHKKNFVVVDYPGTDITDKKSSWEFVDEDIAHLMNSLYHMDLLISTMSTLNLEGCIFDKPLISIGFDGENKIPHYLSTARYYEYEQTHHLVRSGGMSVAYSAQELLEYVRMYCANPSTNADGRKKILEDMVGTVGGRGAYVAQRVMKHIGV